MKNIYKFKNFLVYGLSLSGESVSKLLVKLKANVFLYDDNIESLKAKHFANCFLIQELNENLISQFDYIVISPSIEKDNKFLQIARNHNIKIFSELEFASQFCKNLVAVTGTNGKTTTVELITSILNEKYKAVSCGNIGYPLSKAVLEKKNFIKVVEVSSFMLEQADTFSPNVATILNISPDHIIRHKTMKEYTNLKLSIMKNLKAKNYAVLNLDEKHQPIVNCMTVTYSYNHVADVYYKEGFIYLHGRKIVSINELSLKGKHNIMNIMCAICYAHIYRVKDEKIREALINFRAEKYRIEKVAKINNINFINDSKSTNIASTLACVEAVKGPILLLMGGFDKNLNYAKLFSNLSKRVVKIAVFGAVADKLIDANNDKFNMTKFEDLNSAFDFLVANAKSNDNIVLSPATSSYDQFANYIERGKVFENKVKEYAEIQAQK